jgi:hypothetical protein
MLVVARKIRDVIAIPGHKPLTADKGQARDVAYQWWSENDGAPAVEKFERQRTSWERGLADWKAETQTDVGRGILSGGLLRIKFPDGTRASVAPGQSDELIDSAYLSRHPKPRFPVSPFQQWFRLLKVSSERIWVARLFEDGKETPMPMNVERRQFNFPIPEVLSLLDTLSRAGWTIVHVSEDRGLYSGEDAPSESAITTVRYLLRRSV